MWGKRKKQIAELDEKLEFLDAKIAASTAATSELNRLLLLAGTTEKVLKNRMRRAESIEASLRRASQGR